MKNILILFLSVVSFGQPRDSSVQSLVDYVNREQIIIKSRLDTDTTKYFWKLKSLAAFPVLQNKPCPYFEGYDNYHSIPNLGNVIYQAGPDLFYCGIHFYFAKSPESMDTSFFRVGAYRRIRLDYPPYITWDRIFDYMTVVCKYSDVVGVLGRHDYVQ